MKTKATVVKATAKANEKITKTTGSVATLVKPEVKETKSVKIEEATKSATLTKTVEKAAEENKVEEKKAEEKKSVTVKKAAAKPVVEKKATVKTATTAPKTEKSAVTYSYTIQFAGNEVTTEAITEKVKADYVAAGNKEDAIKDVKLYIKPEEFRVYYVINDEYTSSVSLV